MPRLKTLAAPVLKRPRLSAGLALLLLVVSALVVGRLWIASDGGRAWVLSQIDGRKAGSYGTLSAERLTGDPLGRMQLRRLAVHDAEGEWLVVQNVSIDWAPMALVSGLVDVRALSAGEANFLRQPVTTKEPPSQSSSDIRIKLRSLAIADLAFSKGFAGPEAHFDLSGRYDQHGRSINARLDATPRDTGSDRFLVDLRREAAGPFSLDADINGAPNGIIANLLGLETGTGVTLKAAASGTLENAAGEASLMIEDAQTATARLKIHERRLTAEVDLNATQLPQLGSRLVSLLGENATLRLESTTGRRDAPFGIEASLRAGNISIRGDVNTKNWKLNDPAALDAHITDVSSLLNEPGELTFRGTAAQNREDWLLRGRAGLSVSGEEAIPFRKTEGPVKITLSKDTVALSGDLKTTGLLARTGAVADLIGETSSIRLAGTYDRAGQVLTLGSANAALAAGSVSAAGTLDLSQKTMNLTGNLSAALEGLPGSMRGRVSGPYALSGALTKPVIELNLTAANLTGLPEMLIDATSTSPALRASLRVEDGGLRIDSARLTGQRAVMTAAGRWAWSGTSDVRASVVQSAPVSAGGWDISLGTARVQVTGRQKALRFDISTAAGHASNSNRQITDIALTGDIRADGGGYSGPLSLRADVEGEPLTLDARFERSKGETRLDAMDGKLGPGLFGGTLVLTDAGGFTGDFTVDGTELEWNGVHTKEAKGTIRLVREPSSLLELEANLDAQDLQLAAGQVLRFDRATGTIRSAPEGYDIRANFVSEHPSYPTDLTFIASANFGAPAANGMFEISGQALGEPVSTAAPAHWKLGDTPELDADIALLSGRIKAGFTGGGDDTRLVFDATGVDLSPALALFEAVTNRTYLEGHGDLRVLGADPSGTIHVIAASDVPGVDSSFLLNLDGTLSKSGLRLDLESDYGGRLRLKGDALIPISAAAGRMVAPDRTAPLKGKASLTGDLAVLRTAALAYGHDISGTVDASAEISGTLEAPTYSGKASLSDGTYELGSLGFQLSAVTMDATYNGKTLDVTGKAGAPGGGTFRLSGKLANNETQLSTEFSNLLVYNRDGDHMRGTGNLVLEDGEDARMLTGRVFINQARFSLDNLPSARPHALEVRWTDAPPAPDTSSRLRRTLALDIDLQADRRVYVTGRGLDSEWEIDLALTGTPASPQLNGNTSLIRGDLDLAGRPFVFDSGRIDFDGPINRARINVSAERTVKGFDARVDVTGSPLKPAFELSSSPELPQDEILSRLLFGRSSVDLSPLEAAQLASSIARLSGNSGGFNPAGEVQAALGLDRLSIGASESGGAEIGVGQYLSDDVYLELKSAGVEGSSVEVEWQPRPQVSVSSETSATGESKISIRWKNDY